MSLNRQLTKSVKTVVVSTGVVAGTTNANLTTVDTLGYAGYRICVLLGALTGTQVTKLKVQEFTADTSGSYADVTGAVTAAAADGVIYAEAVRHLFGLESVGDRDQARNRESLAGFPPVETIAVVRGEKCELAIVVAAFDDHR